MTWACKVCADGSHQPKGTVCVVNYTSRKGDGSFRVCSVCDNAHGWPNYVRQH